MKNQKTITIVFFAIFIGVVSGLIIASNLDLTRRTVAADQGSEMPDIALGSSQPISEELLGLEQLSKAFVQVAKEVSPSVVTINSVSVVKMRRHPFMDDEFFRYFFRMPEQREQVRRGLGSGVIINPDGYVLTNNHVISEADEVTVTFEDEEYDAEIIGVDPESDLAVIKIEKKNLPTIKLGNSDELEVGEWVLAIGNPFSDILQNTVTSGIVSAKGRSNLPISGSERSIAYQDFIQTDAAINPGNSGGALVNLRGELVGINTAILGQANVGIGFAIPINMARNVMEQLIDKGRVIRGWLGVMISGVDEEMAQAFDFDRAEGALVQSVVDGSPAEDGGVQDGDIVLKVDDVRIADPDQLTNLIATYAPGTRVRLTVWRDNERKTLTVKLGERPSDGMAGLQESPQQQRENRLGIEVENLTRSLAERLGYEDEEGVVITDVRSNSIADREGLREGDLIVSVNRTAVKDVGDFNRIVSDLETGEIVLLRLKREQMSFFRAFRLPEEK